MDNSFYTKVTGDKITARRWAQIALLITHSLGWRRGFKFFYTHFTVEGKRWKKMLRLSQAAERALMATINANETLKIFERQMREYVTVSTNRRTWLALLEIFEDQALGQMVQDFLSHVRVTDLESFGATCTRLVEQIQAVSSVSEVEGVILEETDYIRTIAIQQLADCFVEFHSTHLTVEQIKVQLRTY